MTGKGEDYPMSIVHRLRTLVSKLDVQMPVHDAAVAAFAQSLANRSVVMDIGAGTAPYRGLLRHCRYIAHDLPDTDLEAPGGLEVLRSDITRIPWPDASLDAILCTGVFEHIERPLEAIDEFARILRPGGRLFLTVPQACRVHRVPTHFYGGLAPDFFERSVPARGFRVDSLRPNGNWSLHMALEIGRLHHVIGHHSSLPARRTVAMAVWPVSRVLVPLVFHALARVDTTDDFPMGWFLTATRLAAATS
jgi:SAM-dependent methyltransferase